jgi:hypothetical protein
MTILRFLSPEEGSGSAADPKAGETQAAGGSEGQSKASGAESGGAQGGEQQKAVASGEPKPQLISPKQLTEILAARERIQRADLQKLLDEKLAGKLGSIEKAIEKISSDSQERQRAKKDDDDDHKEDPRVVELLRQNKELHDQISEVKEAHTKAKREIRDDRFKSIVVSALVRRGCKPDVADLVFRAISPDLKFDEDQKKVTGTDRDEDLGVVVDLEVGDYIDRVVAKKRLPQLFPASTKQGSPAGGDTAGPDGRSKFALKELVKDPKSYLAKRNEMRKAIVAGEVDMTVGPQK